VILAVDASKAGDLSPQATTSQLALTY